MSERDVEMELEAAASDALRATARVRALEAAIDAFLDDPDKVLNMDATDRREAKFAALMLARRPK